MFSFKLCKTYEDLFKKKLNFQNIFKQDSSKIANTYFFPSKTQARLSILFFITSKNQARQQLLEKAQSRSRQEFGMKKSLRSRFSSKSCYTLSDYRKMFWNWLDV